eukprot:GHVS01067593.1.p2 GENE.GHVS01067593.1~~GHVS01067593.1.p2  ORF type:complete len:113 (+),score=20.10 GHVS01067593.1:45-383(+)
MWRDNLLSSSSSNSAGTTIFVLLKLFGLTVSNYFILSISETFNFLDISFSSATKHKQPFHTDKSAELRRRTASHITRVSTLPSPAVLVNLHPTISSRPCKSPWHYVLPWFLC